jgi:hypothetical protein
VSECGWQTAGRDLSLQANARGSLDREHDQGIRSALQNEVHPRRDRVERLAVDCDDPISREQTSTIGWTVWSDPDKLELLSLETTRPEGNADRALWEKSDIVRQMQL